MCYPPVHPVRVSGAEIRAGSVHEHPLPGSCPRLATFQRRGEENSIGPMRRTWPRVVSLLALATAVAPARAKDTTAPSELAPVRAYVESAIAGGLAPSVAVAVVRGDKVVWAEGFGYVDL